MPSSRPHACSCGEAAGGGGPWFHRRVTVLLDPPLWPRHDRIWGHLVSDESLEELHALAAAAGIPRRAFDLDHYDVPAERHDALVAAGAVPVGNRELVTRLHASGLRVSGRDRAARQAARQAEQQAEKQADE